jgi:DnaJ-class molecular chaperone
MSWKDLKKGYADQIAAMAAMAPHELLGVRPDASLAKVKAAYKKLPDKAHAFMARHNEEVVKLVNAAFKKMKDRS